MNNSVTWQIKQHSESKNRYNAQYLKIKVMKCPLILDLIIGFQEIQKCVAIMGGYYMIFFLNSIDVSKMAWSYKSKKKNW